MSKEALTKVVQRAISDASFRRQLNSDPAGALRGFDLTADEVSAVRTGDAGRLSTLGIDQRMSKAFTLGATLAATRIVPSDLSAGNATMIDDASGAGSRTVIPSDPGASLTADEFSGTSTGSAINQTARVGDDWKFTDRAAAQGSVAPIEGSPEATAAELKANSGGMANYPAHDGLAGPSAASGRAGDDWARAGTQVDDSARIGSARLDDASTSGSNAARLARLDETLSGNNPAVDASAPGSDAARLARLDEQFSGGSSAVDPSGAYGTAFVDDSKDPAYQADASGSNAARLARLDETLSGNNPAVDTTGASTSDGTSFIDESEAYLTNVGYDANVAGTKVTDAHDRATWSGDEKVGPSAEDDAGGSGDADADIGPNVDH